MDIKRGFSFIHIIIMIIIGIIVLIIGILIAGRLLGISSSGLEIVNQTLNNTSGLVKIG